MPKFVMKFWSDWRKKWIEFEVECPRMNSIEEYAECITKKLGEEYYRSMYNNCVRRGGDPYVCRIVAEAYRRNYEEKLEPQIEVMLETEIPRRQVKKRLEEIEFLSGDMFAKIQQRTVALAKLTKCMEKHGRKCRMGISSDRLFMIETDSRKREALEELLEIGRVLAKKYAVRSVVYATRHGFHLLALDPMRRDRLREMLGFVEQMMEEGKLKHIDPVYIAMVKARGYFTLSVGKGRDVHYAIVPAMFHPPTTVALFYAPFAMYWRRVVADMVTRFDEILPIQRWEEWRKVREEYVKYRMVVEARG